MWMTPEVMGCWNALAFMSQHRNDVIPSIPLLPGTPFFLNQKEPLSELPAFVHSLCRSQSPQGFGFLTPNHSGSRSQINSLFTTHLNIFWEKWNVALLLFIANNLKDWCLGWSDYLSLVEKDISFPWEMDEDRELCSTIVILNLTLSTCGRR